MTASACFLQIVPARASGARDLPALETAMQSLAPDARSPVALELAATATSRLFLLRATSPLALGHLAQQLQGRYPQAIIRPATSDPLVCAPEEACSVYELRPGAASYLPLRSWKARDLLEEGADPLLGVLAAFGALPPTARAVVQLALVPASPTWSASMRRRAVEHPLEQERAQQRLSGSSGSAPGRAQIAGVFVLVLALLVAFRFRTQVAMMVPPWLLQAGSALVHGKTPHLTGAQTIEIGVFGAILLMLLLALLYGAALLFSRLGQGAIYDQRLVAEKTARPAYRVRLRLYLFGPGDPWPTIRRARPIRQTRLQQIRQFCQRAEHAAWMHVQQTGRRWRRWARRGWNGWWQAVWHRERARWGRGRRRACARANHWGKRRRHRIRAWLRGAWRRGKEVHRRRSRREEVLRLLTAAYRQYHLAAGGYFVPRRLSAWHVRRLLASPGAGRWCRTGWPAGVARSSHLLSVADLAALWHLPQAQDLAELPYVERSTMRTLLAPTKLSTGQGYPLGVSTHAGQSLPVFLPFACLSHNMLIAASTGKGKSTLLEHLMCAFAQARLAGHPAGAGGALFVDPHGDQVEHVSGTLPASLMDDVVLIRLADREYPIGFNPLDMSQGQERDKVIDNLIQVVEALWPTSYGPRTENFLEYGCKTLAEANLTITRTDPIHGPDRQFTLLDVVHLFRQETFRHAVFELVTDTHILNWWKDYYEQLDGRQQAEFTSSLVTKMSKFASSHISRRILGQPRSSLNFAELIRHDTLILLSCAAGDVGADLAALFGSLFLGFFQTALAEQARLHPEERQRFVVLIDEFQTLKVDYQTMLAELRKYGGSFALATQSLAYLDRFDNTLRATVLANVEHTFAFALAAEDARLLHLPEVELDDILHLPDYSCYARLSMGGERLPIFSLRLAAPREGSPEVRQDIISRCRTRYGRPMGTVDQELADCEARQHTMRPARMRRGAKGYGVIWSGTEDERVGEVLASAQEQRAGREQKQVREETAALPQHTMYAQHNAPAEGPETHAGEDEGPTDAE